jgi:osmotically inducible protein OsmC
MATRQAHARWEGNLNEGRGTVDFGRGAFSAPYSFASRFAEGTGTNPEELLGAAHASCFAMALSLALSEAGFKPHYVDAIASVTIEPSNGGFQISRSHLQCEADVPGIDAATFATHAENAKANCPVSKSLARIPITLQATLRSQ